MKPSINWQRANNYIKAISKLDKKKLAVATLAQVLLGQLAHAAPAKVFFIAPQSNQSVGQNFNVKFGVEGFEVSPAGKIEANKGHHHLIIDGGPIAKGQVIPNDPTHLHFGKGQTETNVALSPGKHKLTLQFADGAHISYGESMSATIEVEVKK